MNSGDHLDALTQAYLDGTITADEAQELNALLREDAGARRAFAEQLNLDSSIAAAAAGWSMGGAGCRPARRGVLPMRRLLAAAACVALLLGGASLWRDARRVYAEVEKSVGVETLPAGTVLRRGTHVIDEGSVEILTRRGARVVVEAPAEFRFESEQRLRLIRGRLAADVPPGAKGFTVVTPSGDAVDLGTRFGVDVPVEGAPEIHVFEGEVIAKASGAAGERNLVAGDAVALEAGRSDKRELRSAAFIQPDELRELDADGEGRQRARSAAALDALRADPALIALLDFESGLAHPGTFRTVQGRWPGSRAPEFIHGGDHLKLELGDGGTWPRLTLAAWVRLDQLGAPYQSLLHADGWDGEFGLVHWMVNEATTMRFAIWGNRPPPGFTDDDFYPNSQTPVLAERGRWVHLATVYDSDAKTVRFYLNGRFDNEIRQAVAHPARFGPAQIGNWNREERKLSGRIDELVILGRAMGDAEVRALYEAGNPYLK